LHAVTLRFCIILQSRCLLERKQERIWTDVSDFNPELAIHFLFTEATLVLGIGAERPVLRELLGQGIA